MNTGITLSGAFDGMFFRVHHFSLTFTSPNPTALGLIGGPLNPRGRYWCLYARHKTIMIIVVDHIMSCSRSWCWLKRNSCIGCIIVNIIRLGIMRLSIMRLRKYESSWRVNVVVCSEISSSIFTYCWALMISLKWGCRASFSPWARMRLWGLSWIGIESPPSSVGLWGPWCHNGWDGLAEKVSKVRSTEGKQNNPSMEMS